MTMLSSTYLASTSTPLVCKFYGVCWREQEVWLVMELCAESSVRLVDRAREDLQAEGLPPIDVVVLALEVQYLPLFLVAGSLPWIANAQS